MLILPEHNPVILAKRAATIDRLSGGRLILGVGGVARVMISLPTQDPADLQRSFGALHERLISQVSLRLGGCLSIPPTGDYSVTLQV